MSMSLWSSWAVSVAVSSWQRNELRVFWGVFLAARFSSLASPSSDGIHKRLFGAVEDDDAQEQGECREGRCVGQSGQRRVA